MSNQTLITAKDLEHFGIYFQTTQNIHDFIKERFLITNSEGVEEYDFEDLAIDEVMEYCVDKLDWYQIWDESIFDLFYLYIINFFHNYIGIPYKIIIKEIIPTSDSFEYYAKCLYDDGGSILNSDCIIDNGIETPEKLLEAKQSNESPLYNDFAVNEITLTRALLGDAILGFLEESDYDYIDFLKNHKDKIIATGIVNDNFIEYLENEESLRSIFDNCFNVDTIEYENLIASCYPGYQGGNRYLGSLISKVEFKYIMDAILLEEIPEYTADDCGENQALYCDVIDRSGWYEFKTIDLTEDIDYYNFNPQYSSTIYISLPTEDEKKLIISGLYHWELKLLSLDLHDEKNLTLMIDFPEREPFNEKDVLEMERYLQELNSNKDEEKKLDDDLGLTLRLRTKNNLMELLQVGKSGAWKVAKDKEKQISRVQIFNWDGSMMLVAAHDVSNSFRRSEDNRLVVALDNEDAKIIKCDPPFQWVGQNPVNYVNETSATSKNNLVEDKTVEKNSEPVANKTEIKEPVPHAPEDFTHLSPQLAELCKSVYGEPVRLIHWQMKNNNREQQFRTLFRECRRGWYFQMLLTQKGDKWTSEHRVLPSFLNLLEPDETTWAKLTKLATLEDWYALDEIFLNTIIFPNSRVIFAGSDLVGEEVADEALEKFGFYVPDEDLLPVLLFESRNLGVSLISYFRHSDGFAKENMLSDDNTDVCEVYESLTEAQKRLNQKLSYYQSEA